MKRQRRRRINKWVLAFSITELLAVSAIVASVPLGSYARAKQMGVQTECINNLRQIGQSIVMYQMGEGKYPEAAFFPDDPKKGEDSIIVILAEASGRALPDQMWVCPAAPDALRKKCKGLTFVYNDAYGGRASLKSPDKAWLLIEVNCVSRKAPKPHPKGYNVLFADGHVFTTKILPPSITANQRAMFDDLERRLDFNDSKLAGQGTSPANVTGELRAMAQTRPVCTASTVSL